MKKISKILVATDFSVHSDCAVHLAKEIQNKLMAEITFIHISDVPPFWDLPAANQRAKDKLMELKEEINATLDIRMKEQFLRCGLTFTAMIKFGNPLNELKTCIDTMQADLLIMGQRGETGLFAMGSFTEKMVATSPIPILVAKNNKSIKTVVGLLDPSHLSPKSIAFTNHFASALSAKSQFLTVIPDLTPAALMDIPFVMPAYKFNDQEKLQIITNAKAAIQKVEKTLSEDKIHVEISTLATNKALTKSLNELKADLAIVVKHNRGALERFFIGSVSKGILNEFDGNIILTA